MPASSMLVSVPAAAAATSRYSPSAVNVASWGERKLRNTATRRSPRPNIVTVPDPGLTTATGPPGAAATVLGSTATGIRRSARPPGTDTTTSSFLSSAVTSATSVVRWVAAGVGCGASLVACVVGGGGIAGWVLVAVVASPVQDGATRMHTAKVVNLRFTTVLRPAGLAASYGMMSVSVVALSGVVAGS